MKTLKGVAEMLLGVAAGSVYIGVPIALVVWVLMLSLTAHS